MRLAPKTFLRPGLAAGMACSIGALAGLESSLPSSSNPDGVFALILLASSTTLLSLALVAATLVTGVSLTNRSLRTPIHRTCLLLILVALGHVAGSSAAPEDSTSLPEHLHRDDPPVLLTGTVHEPPRWRWHPPRWGELEDQRGLSLTLRVDAVAEAIDPTREPEDAASVTSASNRPVADRFATSREDSIRDVATRDVTGRGDSLRSDSVPSERQPTPPRLSWKPASGLVLLSMHALEHLSLSGDIADDGHARIVEGRPGRLPFGIGDRVELVARLRRVSPPANPGERDRARQLWRSGIARVGSSDVRSVVVVEPWHGPAHRAQRFRTAFADAVTDRLGPTDEAALVTALSVGERGDLGLELQEDFRRSGLAHLLALSGLHLGVLVVSLLWVLRRLFSLSAALSARIAPRILASALTLPITGAYVVLVGAPPSTIRAGIAAALVLVGQVLGRRPDSLNIWGWCLAAMALIEPPLLHLVSTQLSFAGVLGILVLTRPLRELLPIPLPDPEKRPSLPKRLGESVLMVAVVSTAAALATGPLVALYFEQSAILGTLANVLAWPSTALVVPAGATAAVLFAIHPPLAGPVLDLAGIAARLLKLAAEAVSALPGATLPVAAPGPLSLLAMATFLVLIAHLKTWKRRRLLRVGALGTLLASLALGPGIGEAMIRRLAGGPMEVTFLAVGQGDASVIRFPRGSTMVVDAGGTVTGRFDPGARIVAPFLLHKGIRRIDVLVASHPHPDHIGGLFAVLERFRVGELWHNGHRMDEGESQRPLLEAARSRGVNLVEYRQGLVDACPDLPPLDDAFPHVAALRVGDPRCATPPPARTIDGVRIEILHPLGGPERAAFPELGENDNSVVLRLTHGDVRVLLPGDLEWEGESLLLASGIDLQADVLKAPHHGSRTSSTEAFLDAVRPRHVVFCVGENNQFGFPSPAVDQRYERRQCQRHRTDHHGAITFVSDGQGVTVRRFRE